MRSTITVHPNQELFRIANDIPKEHIKSDTFTQIGSSMLEILREKGGIGLSANQVGLSFNMCVIELTSGNCKILINPRLTKLSTGMMQSNEGCLSLPGVTAKVNRHQKVTVEYEDVTGETQSYEAFGLESCCLQHEIDHLKGILMINRLTEHHKSQALKQLHRFKRNRNGRRL